MRDLLIVAQSVDEGGEIGFFLDWIREFAVWFDRVYVVALARGKFQLPHNVFVYSLGKERGVSKVVQVVRLVWYCFKFVPRSEGIFVHMSPKLVSLVWPAAFIFRHRLILWYLHRSVKFRHRLAYFLCDYIATAAKESLNIKGPKIIELGHGINTELFHQNRSWEKEGTWKILSVNRFSPIKNLETLISACGILRDHGIDFELNMVGFSVGTKDVAYFDSLKTLAADLKLEEKVNFLGFVPFSQIGASYKSADIFVNLSPTGGIDKTILEAMAAGCLILTSNMVMNRYLGEYSKDLLFEYKSPGDLARRIEALINLPVNSRVAMSEFLVKEVEKNHSLGKLIPKISKLFL